MTTDNNGAPGNGGPEPVAPGTGPAGEPPREAGSAPAGLTPEQKAALTAEVAELRDRLLRAHAEMDNMRKRAEREKADAHKYAISKFARDIVTVGDNFQRAVSTVPPGAVEQMPALKSLVDGVTMTEREFLKVLENNGIKRVDPHGDLFNPHLHQAISEIENTTVPSGTVVQVFQSGYTIEDRVLRPAMVVVARGGAKPARPAETSAAATSERESGEADA